MQISHSCAHKLISKVNRFKTSAASLKFDDAMRRAVLDVLEDAGVARSRSEALAWCVRMVGANLDEWLRDLRTAFEHVERVRARGPRNEE